MSPDDALEKFLTAVLCSDLCVFPQSTARHYISPRSGAVTGVSDVMAITAKHPEKSSGVECVIEKSNTDVPLRHEGTFSSRILCTSLHCIVL